MGVLKKDSQLVMTLLVDPEVFIQCGMSLNTLPHSFFVSHLNISNLKIRQNEFAVISFLVSPQKLSYFVSEIIFSKEISQ